MKVKVKFRKEFKIFKKGRTLDGPVQILSKADEYFDQPKKIEFYKGLGYKVTDIVKRKDVLQIRPLTWFTARVGENIDRHNGHTRKYIHCIEVMDQTHASKLFESQTHPWEGEQTTFLYK
jgi:hypothetical protein